MKSATNRNKLCWIVLCLLFLVSSFDPFFCARVHRSCGGIFCGVCSDHTASLPDMSYSKPVRVCQNCFMLICDVRKQGLLFTGAGLATIGGGTNGLVVGHHHQYQHHGYISNSSGLVTDDMNSLRGLR